MAGPTHEELEAIRARNRAALGLAGLAAPPTPRGVRFPSIAGPIARQIKYVKVRSQVSPDVTLEQGPGGWFEPRPGPPSFGAQFLKSIVKPEIEVGTPLGPIRVAPYGVPERRYDLVVIAGGAVVLGGLVAWVVSRFVRQARKREAA